MRKQFCDSLLKRSDNPAMTFLTGDLGFMALEPLQISLKERFINAGVAEQNMISVAASFAREGWETWVYSIAPFCYARPFEQIRNDICFHNLPVKIVGNGGGYGYGVMGPTHHAIEDYGIMLTLPNMRVLVPAFDEDVFSIIEIAGEIKSPVYLRLGKGEVPENYVVPDYKSWRQLTHGGGGVIIGAGPIVGTYIECLENIPEIIRPNLWVVTELPIDKNPMPTELLNQLSSSKGLIVIEEHVKRAGLGSELALFILENKLPIGSFQHLYARAHHFEKYGSQKFLRQKSQLDINSLLALLEQS
jgi:transketolase